MSGFLHITLDFIIKCLQTIYVNIIIIIVERGRFVLNKTYKSISNVLKKEDVLLTSNTQIKAKIHKTYLTHWLFKDIVLFILKSLQNL